MSKKFKRYFYTSVLAAVAVFGQKASIETTARPTNITIGDYITYTVTITREKGISIAWPGAAAELGQFQIVDFEMGDPVDIEGGKVRETSTYFISTYDVGEWTIPPTAIAYFDSAEDTTVILRTEPIKITVKSLLSEADWSKIRAIAESDTSLAGMEKQIAAGRILQMAKEEMLRDITKPTKIKRGARFWIGLGVIALVLAGLVVGFIYWRRRKGSIGAIFSLSAPPLPPHEAALAELAALVAKGWIANREFKKFYTRLSEILREYIEGRMGVQALELSTSETIFNLSNSKFPIHATDIDNLKDLLDRCDLVKFAKLVPPEEWHSEVIETAREFVERTKPEEPKEAPVPEGNSPSGEEVEK